MEQMTASPEQRATVDRDLEATVRRFNDAFNRRDPKEVASFWAENGTLLNPVGNYGEGRAGVERVFREDAATVLQGATAKFSLMRARPVGDCALLDLDLEMQNARKPDGSIGTARMHVVVLARRQAEGWRWVDVRPYALMPRPSDLH